jgi:acyl carrier protein
MTNTELIELFAEAVEVEPSTIQPEKKISEYEEWNSLAWLTIMSLLDERFAVRLSGPEIRSFVSVQDVIDKVIAKSPDE